MKQLILVLMFFQTINICYSQQIEGKITYQATLNKDTFLERLNNDTLMPKFRKDHRIQAAKDAIPENFHLFFKGRESLYKSEYDMMTKKRLGLLMNQTGFTGRDNMTYYVNIETKEKFYQSFWTKHILVNMDDIDWKLTQETKKIGRYTCFKATAQIDSKQTYGMNFMSPVVAWYTPEIPVPFGIQNFVGLPGLTLELVADFEVGKIYYYATKIELNPEKEIKIEKPEGKQRVSEQEYVEKLERLNDNRRNSGE